VTTGAQAEDDDGEMAIFDDMIELADKYESEMLESCCFATVRLETSQRRSPLKERSTYRKCRVGSLRHKSLRKFITTWTGA
jgi:hypothetical protein